MMSEGLRVLILLIVLFLPFGLISCLGIASFGWVLLSLLFLSLLSGVLGHMWQGIRGCGLFRGNWWLTCCASLNDCFCCVFLGLILVANRFCEEKG